jgi:hypothetical protein
MDGACAHLPTDRLAAGRLRPSSHRPPPTMPRYALSASSSLLSCRGMHAAMPCNAGSIRGAHYRRLATGELARVGLTGRGPCHFGLFGAVAGPWQAERALCVWATLIFWPSGQFN